MVDVTRHQTGPVQAVEERLGAEIGGVLDEGLVGGGEGGQLGVGLERQRQVAAAHQRVAVDARQPANAVRARLPETLQRGDQRFLIVVVRGQRASDRGDVHVAYPHGPLWRGDGRAKPPTVASRTPYLDSASGYQRSSVPGESSTSTRTRALRSAGGWVRDVPTRIDGTFEVPLFARAGAIVPEM